MELLLASAEGTHAKTQSLFYLSGRSPFLLNSVSTPCSDAEGSRALLLAAINTNLKGSAPRDDSPIAKHGGKSG